MSQALESVDDYRDAIARGDRRAVARTITQLESTRPDQNAFGQRVLEKLVPSTGGAVRVGITGPPGVGKSTLIEALGLYLLEQGHKVAVLAVDPTSPVSGGSILGDKTRMERLAREPNAFIRPSPSGGSLGGVAQRTREAMLVCEAAGYDVVLIETVGIGQSEVTVASMVDFFLVLLLPGGGDELQGIKKGVIELADALVVNKADGPSAEIAERTRREYEGASASCAPARAAGSPSLCARAPRPSRASTRSGRPSSPTASTSRAPEPSKPAAANKPEPGCGPSSKTASRPPSEPTPTLPPRSAPSNETSPTNAPAPPQAPEPSSEPSEPSRTDPTPRHPRSDTCPRHEQDASLCCWRPAMRPTGTPRGPAGAAWAEVERSPATRPDARSAPPPPDQRSATTDRRASHGAQAAPAGPDRPATPSGPTAPQGEWILESSRGLGSLRFIPRGVWPMERCGVRNRCAPRWMAGLRAAWFRSTCRRVRSR